MVPRQRARGELLSYADVFAIDLNAALLEQLPQALDSLEPVSLTEENLSALGPEHGVYQLFHAGESVYIGKSQDTLRVRLNQHRRRCMGRLGIDVSDMSFRCLYVDKFVDAASPESVLIKRYREAGLAPWNVAEGFAPKDVGRGRASGKPGQWFLDRPVDHLVTVRVAGAGGPMPVLGALAALKAAVPFDLFRYASDRSGSESDKASVVDYVGREVTLERGKAPLMSHLRRVVAALPVGWQATVEPPGVQIYREEVNYPYAMDGWRHESHGLARLERGQSLRMPTI
ncbi:GIY-YIG nuclease family protein [Micromonospora sp. NBC_01699]|uniref:GIY-YIG nuclease family protein n=1 Tax=Micromonospora sp. NBC_01699 TaxID=2975984 RepID=UPI002E2AE41B|nr:GIY-YIG nuclease family protein [Micromonospora sp. NBC_01699]